MSDEGKGCCGCMVVICALPFLFGGFTIVKLAFNDLVEWRNDRLEEKAKQAELQKAKEAEEARIAEAKRKQKAAEDESMRRQAAEAAEVKRRQDAKDEKIRTFALDNAPKIWSVCQSLQGEIDVQNVKIEELRKTLKTFGKIPEQDKEFKYICAMRNDMIRSRQTLRTKLEDAYIAAKKYEAAPSRKDYQELHKKALEDGILEADAASVKFKEMRLNK